MTHSKVFFPSGFFSDGWGDITVPERFWQYIADMQSQLDAKTFLPKDIAVELDHRTLTVDRDAVMIEGKFASPQEDTELLPTESRTAYFQLVTPRQWHEEKVTPTLKEVEGRRMSSQILSSLKDGADRRLVVILPGTGEHRYTRRLCCLALPLAQQGVASIILEGPFYGKRKPRKQRGSKLRHVSDLPVLGRATVEEAISLLSWSKEVLNVPLLCVAGGSMGGLHAAMTGAYTPFPIAVTSWLGPPSAVPVFTKGLLSTSCDWHKLSLDAQKQRLDEALRSFTDRVMVRAALLPYRSPPDRLWRVNRFLSPEFGRS